MSRRRVTLRRSAIGSFTVAAIAAGWISSPSARQAPPGAAQAPMVSHGSSEREALDRYCVTCHNDRMKTAGLALDVLDVETPGAHADTWEKVVAKLRSGTMPPAGRPRPDDGPFVPVHHHFGHQQPRVVGAGLHRAIGAGGMHGKEIAGKNLRHVALLR